MVNAVALRRYVRDARGEADAQQYDKKGHPRGSLRKLSRAFLRKLGRAETVRVTYRHSLLGAELVAAGFVAASRSTRVGKAADPLALHEVEFVRRGHDLDDLASYPRACRDVFEAAAVQSQLFMRHRRTILDEVGLHYLGSCASADVR